MVCGHEFDRAQGRAEVAVVKLAPEFANRCISVKQRARCMGAQRHDYPRFYELNLLDQIRHTPENLVGLGISIVRRSALQNIRNEDLISTQAAGPDNFVEQLSGSAHKRSALGVFISPRGFTNEQDVSPGMALTRHCVSAGLAQFTLGTLADCLYQGLE